MFPNRHSFPFAVIHRHSLVPSPAMRLAASVVTMVTAEAVDSKGVPLPHKPRRFFTGVTFYNLHSGAFEAAVPMSTLGGGGRGGADRRRAPTGLATERA